MNNTGLFNLYTPNKVDSLNNFNLGIANRDGSLWMMATDEGMNPEFFSDGANSNFSVLAKMTEMLDARALDEDIVSMLKRVRPGNAASATGLELQSAGHVVDLHDLIGSDIDYLAIDAEVNEMLHGAAPEIDDEELADVLSEGEGFSDGFDAALSEIVSE